MINRHDRFAGEKWLEELAGIATSRGFSCARWGESEGLPLLGFRRHGAAAAPRIYLSAGIHGDEPAGPLAVERLLRLDHLDPRATWTVCPLLNPGGWLAGTRESPSGVDLNRDYRFARSPEVASHCEWIKSVAPHDLYLSLHEDWETTGFYLYELNNSRVVPFGTSILDEVSGVIPIEPLRLIDRHVVRAPGYIAHEPEPDEPLNWPEAIYHIKMYPHISYTFETPSSIGMEDRVSAHIMAVLSAVARMFESWIPVESLPDRK